jgi:hypothetical protein
MSKGAATLAPQPLPLAVAIVAVFAAAVLTTGVTKAAIFVLTFEVTAEAEFPTPGPDGAT